MKLSADIPALEETGLYAQTGNKGFEIDVARAPREAFYGNIPLADAALAKQTESGLWVFDSQHITLEKNIDPDNPAMGPHWTLRYRHKKDRTQTCVIHAYFNKKMALNGCYQQRIIQVNLDGTESTLFAHNYVGGNIRVDTPYPGVPLAIHQIKDLAAFGARILTGLDAERAAKYVKLYQEIQAKELEITEILHNKAEGYLEQASAKINDLGPVIDELNFYTDGKKNRTDVLIQRQVQAFKALSTRCIKPREENDAIVDDAVSIAQPETSSLVEQKQSKVDPEVDPDKEPIQTQISDLIEQAKAENGLESETFYQQLQALITALNLFELMYDSADDEDFSRAQRAQLPETYFNLAEHFKQAVLTGNLSVVQAMFGVVELHMDLVDLFSELLEIIEAGQDGNLCDRLIPVVYYLHEHSDVFQAFVVFKMTNLEYTISDNPSENTVRFKLLTSMYAKDNLKAYRLYLDLGCSPESIQARCGPDALNALQTILLFRNRDCNRKPYVEALFEHGALISTRPRILHSIVQRRVPVGVSRTSNEATFFHAYKSSSGKKKDKMSIQKGEPKSTRPAENIPTFDTLTQKENILASSWALFQFNAPDVVDLMANHCDMKTCLLEFTNIVAQNDCGFTFLASTLGGAAFHINQESLHKDASTHQKFLNSDKSTVLLAERKTVRFYAMISPTCQMSGEQQSNVQASARAIYQAFERAFQVLPDQKKRCFVTTLRKLVVRSKLQNELEGKPLVETLILYQAVIIAHSLIEQMVVKDYQSMINIILDYGKMCDKANGARTESSFQMYANLKYLIENALSSDMSVALAPDMQAVYEAIESYNAGLSGGVALK
ncbi:MAG: hypothetical protein P1U36_00140 [Legionellaceae bacterium]|nr:hypothetical protein [Legionellaceae bacterium]